ncbi:LamG domain-containing protein, partial [Paenibacillus nasutitermitis]|uniref:LamG domain-containing protein n=1 Tax=Paenibacillus nasutitermitis TaxID=1652958 RepID=UPI00166E8E30
IQSGSLGFGYGAQGIWNDLYAEDDYGVKYGEWLGWYDGLNLPGGAQMGYMKRFYTALDWWKLVPRFGDTAWADFVKPGKTSLKSDGNESYVVYFYDNDRKTGRLKQMDDDSAYRAQWFDPLTGLYYPLNEPVTSSSGAWCIPLKPNAADWVLLVEKEKPGHRKTEPSNLADLDPAIQQAIAESASDSGSCYELPDDSGNVELPSPVGEWSFEEKSGNSIIDLSGNGNSATLVQGADIGNGDVSGHALILDGVDDYATIADHPLLDGMDQFSISFWVNLSSLPTQNYSIIGKEAITDAMSGNSYRIIVTPSGKGHFVMSTASAGWYSTRANFTVPLQPGLWYHLVAVYDGQNARIYIDGNEEGVSNDISGSLLDTNEPIRIGYKSANNVDYTKAMMDEIQIYDKALTPQQILKLHDTYMN